MAQISQTHEEFAELILLILEHLKNHYREIQREESSRNERIENQDIPLSNEEKINEFQKGMKKILESDAPEKLKNVARSFYENPKEAMQLIHSVANQEILEKAKTLKELSNETIRLADETKKYIDMKHETSLDILAGLNSIAIHEKEKIRMADEIINDGLDHMKKYENERNDNEIEKDFDNGMEPER